MERRGAAGALLALAACFAYAAAAPTGNEQTALDLYEEGTVEGCYYNFQHYGEGDRIMTNEPCLNCTCHNRMLMCYLRVCPFTKPIGRDCTVEKRADQCCPIITCPDVPVDLLTSTSTHSPAEYDSTGVDRYDRYGCSINGKYYSEGSKVPQAPDRPCEHCYCIRNMTTCVMQECTLHVDGCTPYYHKDVCCPVRYSCDHEEDEILKLDDMTTTVRPTPGFLLTTTMSSVSQDCVHDDQIFADGALIKTEKACEHCYCMKGDIVCVVQECGTPMENEGKNCTSLPPREGQCCPDTYICEGDNEVVPDHLTTSGLSYEETTEGSGYAKGTVQPHLDEMEGSGLGEISEAPVEVSSKLPEDLVVTHASTPIIIIDETESEDQFLTTTSDNKPKPQDSNLVHTTEEPGSTIEPDKGENTVPHGLQEEETMSTTEVKGRTTTMETPYSDKISDVTTSEPIIDKTTYPEETVSHKDVTTPGAIAKESTSHEEASHEGISTPTSVAEKSTHSEQAFSHETVSTSSPIIEETTYYEIDIRHDEITTSKSMIEKTTYPEGISSHEYETTSRQTDKETTGDMEATSHKDITTSKPMLEESTNEEAISHEDITTPMATIEESKHDEEIITPEVVSTPEPLIVKATERDGSIASEAATTSRSIIEETTYHEEVVIHEDVTTSKAIIEETSYPGEIITHDEATTSRVRLQETTQSDEATSHEVVSTLRPIIKETTYSEEAFTSRPLLEETTYNEEVSTSSSIVEETTLNKDDVSHEQVTSSKPTKDQTISQEDVFTSEPILEETTYHEEASHQGISTSKPILEETTYHEKDIEHGGFSTSRPIIDDIAGTTEDVTKNVEEDSFTTKDEQYEATESSVSEVAPEQPGHEPAASTTISASDSKTTSILETVTRTLPPEQVGTVPIDEEQATESSRHSTMETLETSDRTTVNEPLVETSTSIQHLITTEKEITDHIQISQDEEKELQTQRIPAQDFTTQTASEISTTSPEITTISRKQETDVYITTESPDRLPTTETSSAFIGDNEIEEDERLPPISSIGIIPGEGACLVNGVTYSNESVVPTINKCQKSCKCMSSIVNCETIQCEPPPEKMINCQPEFDSGEACCPTYTCDHLKETKPPESHNQMSITETLPPQKEECGENCVTDIAMKLPACDGDKCTVEEEEIKPVKSPELCSSGSCDIPADDILASQEQVPCTGDCVLAPKPICDGDKCAVPAVGPTEIPQQHVETEPQISTDCIGELCTNKPTKCKGDTCGQICNGEQDCKPKVEQTQLPCGTDNECKDIRIPSCENGLCIESQPEQPVNVSDCADCIPPSHIKPDTVVRKEDTCADEQDCEKPIPDLSPECQGNDCMSPDISITEKDITVTSELFTPSEIIQPELTTTSPQFTELYESSATPETIMTSITTQSVYSVATETEEMVEATKSPIIDTYKSTETSDTSTTGLELDSKKDKTSIPIEHSTKVDIAISETEKTTEIIPQTSIPEISTPTETIDTSVTQVEQFIETIRPSVPETEQSTQISATSTSEIDKSTEGLPTLMPQLTISDTFVPDIQSSTDKAMTSIPEIQMSTGIAETSSLEGVGPIETLITSGPEIDEEHVTVVEHTDESTEISETLMPKIEKLPAPTAASDLATEEHTDEIPVTKPSVQKSSETISSEEMITRADVSSEIEITTKLPTTSALETEKSTVTYGTTVQDDDVTVLDVTTKHALTSILENDMSTEAPRTSVPSIEQFTKTISTFIPEKDASLLIHETTTSEIELSTKPTPETITQKLDTFDSEKTSPPFIDVSTDVSDISTIKIDTAPEDEEVHTTEIKEATAISDFTTPESKVTAEMDELTTIPSVSTYEKETSTEKATEESDISISEIEKTTEMTAISEIEKSTDVNTLQPDLDKSTVSSSITFLETTTAAQKTVPEVIPSEDKVTTSTLESITIVPQDKVTVEEGIYTTTPKDIVSIPDFTSSEKEDSSNVGTSFEKETEETNLKEDDHITTTTKIIEMIQPTIELSTKTTGHIDHTDATTVYLVELEEHTHKPQKQITEIIIEDGTTEQTYYSTEGKEQYVTNEPNIEGDRVSSQEPSTGTEEELSSIYPKASTPSTVKETTKTFDQELEEKYTTLEPPTSKIISEEEKEHKQTTLYPEISEITLDDTLTKKNTSILPVLDSKKESSEDQVFTGTPVTEISSTEKVPPQPSGFITEPVQESNVKEQDTTSEEISTSVPDQEHMTETKQPPMLYEKTSTPLDHTEQKTESSTTPQVSTSIEQSTEEFTDIASPILPSQVFEQEVKYTTASQTTQKEEVTTHKTQEEYSGGTSDFIVSTEHVMQSSTSKEEILTMSVSVAEDEYTKIHETSSLPSSVELYHSTIAPTEKEIKQTESVNLNSESTQIPFDEKHTTELEAVTSVSSDEDTTISMISESSQISSMEEETSTHRFTESDVKASTASATEELMTEKTVSSEYIPIEGISATTPPYSYVETTLYEKEKPESVTSQTGSTSFSDITSDKTIQPEEITIKQTDEMFGTTLPPSTLGPIIVSDELETKKETTVENEEYDSKTTTLVGVTDKTEVSNVELGVSGALTTTSTEQAEEEIQKTTTLGPKKELIEESVKPTDETPESSAGTSLPDHEKPDELSTISPVAEESPKPVIPDEIPPPTSSELPTPDEDTEHQTQEQFPPSGSGGYGSEQDYGDDDQAFGPGTCRYGGKVYVSAQQIPRDDPCDFCFCFRSDIICLQQSCPPPIHGCHEEPIQGFCCPRYECPVSMATTLNVTTTTTTTTTTLPPHFLPHAYKGAAQKRGCQIKGHSYNVGDVIKASSGPCLHCTCGGNGQMKCDPKACTPEPMLRQMIAAAVSSKRRR